MFGEMKYNIMDSTKNNKPYLFEEVILKKDTLIPYGILEEESNIRVHIANRKIFVFKTFDGKKLVEEFIAQKIKLTKAFQLNVDEATAYGYPVKPELIKNIKELHFDSWEEWDYFNKKWSTTEKGKWAVRCVIKLIELGLFPLWLDVKQNENIELDIKGTDIFIGSQHIQVKCDYRFSDTGNLFLQTHESNPLKLY